MTLALHRVQPWPRPTLADECADARLAVAAIDQLCGVPFEEAVSRDRDPFREPLGQDALAWSGRQEHGSVLSVQDMDDPTTGPIGDGLAEERYFRGRRQRIGYVGLHRGDWDLRTKGLQDKDGR